MDDYFKKGMDYENLSNHDNVGWFDKGPWHNKNICSKLYGTAILQEWKLNIDAKEYEKNMLLCHKPSSKKRINLIENFYHWPESIKRTIEWFPFLHIIEYTENEMIGDISLTISLLKMFSMFSVKITVRDVTVN